MKKNFNYKIYPIIGIAIAVLMILTFHSCNKGSQSSDSNLSAFSLDSLNSLDDLLVSAQKSGGNVTSYTSNGGENALLSMGDLSACVVMIDGRLKCWGYNADKQLGDDSVTNRITPITASAVTDKVVSVSCSLNHTCIYTNNGLKCFGSQNYGKLGNSLSGTTKIGIPVKATVLGGRQIKSMVTGDEHVCVLYSDNKSVACYGLNSDGQLGDGTSGAKNFSLTPKDVKIGEEVRSIAASDKASCAVTVSNKLYCWGLSLKATPDLIASNVIQVSSGEKEHLCYITSNKTAACFGANNTKQLGKEELDSTFNKTPNPIPGLTDVNATIVGASHSCAITNNHTKVYCWGDNLSSQLGTGNSSPANSATPLEVTDLPSGVEIIDIAAQDNVTCVLLKNDDVWCWGNNSATGTGDYLGVNPPPSSSNKPIKILNRNDG